MKNHPIYIKVKNCALANLSYAGFEAVTPGEILKAAGAEGKVSGTFATNIKRGVLSALKDRDDEIDLQQIKSKVKTYLDTNFPDWEAEKGREGGKPYIKIWLKGKP
jgi:hypothetical protein